MGMTIDLQSHDEADEDPSPPDERHKYCVLLDTAWQVLQTPEIITRCTAEALEDLVADGIIYTELHISPRSVGRMSAKEYVEAVVRGVEAACEPGWPWQIKAQLVINVQRGCTFQDAFANVRLAVECPTCVGVALVGDPRVDKLEVWDYLSSCFEEAREEGLKVSISSFMEVRNTKEACAQIEFDPDRIGHGATMLTDPVFWKNFAEPLAAFPVPVEIHATSDVMTQLSASSVPDHHFSLLRERLTALNSSATQAHYPMLICSSYPSVFPDARLSDEIAKLGAAFKLSRSAMMKIQTEQLDHLFCSEEMKVWLPACLPA
jgi:adenosine deaminase